MRQAVNTTGGSTFAPCASKSCPSSHGITRPPRPAAPTNTDVDAPDNAKGAPAYAIIDANCGEIDMPKRTVTTHKPMLPPLTATNSSDDERASVIEPTNIQPALNLAAKKMAITRPTEKPTQKVAVTPVAVLALPYPICST